MTFFDQSGQSVGHQVNVGGGPDLIPVDAEYMAWLDDMHTQVARLVATLPASWQGWEPTNEQMRMLDVLRDMIREHQGASA